MILNKIMIKETRKLIKKQLMRLYMHKNIHLKEKNHYFITVGLDYMVKGEVLPWCLTVS